MKKKMIIAAVFVAALALTASVAFAHKDSKCCDRRSKECCPKVEVNADSSSTVVKDLRTRGNSGANYVTVGFMGSANLTTGNAAANTQVSDTVDGSWVEVDMPDRGSVEVNADSNSYVQTNVRTKANSGRNHVTSHMGGATANTGAASATTGSTTTVTGSTVYVK